MYVALFHNLDYENRSLNAYREIEISDCGMNNKLTISAIMEQRIFQTLIAGLPVAPSEVRIEEISNTWIRVAWEHPEPSVTFEVTYETKDCSSLHKISNVKLHHLEIEELTANAEYRIVVRAANEFGIGMSSLPLVYVNNATVNFNFQACFQNCLSLDSYCISSGVLLLNFCVSILGAMVWCIVAKTERKKVLLATVKYEKKENEEDKEADCNIYYEIVDN
jgi:Fibronectin type III domain